VDSILSFVISFDLRELFEVVSDSPPEAEVFVFAREKSLEVSKLFSKEEVGQCQITQSELSIANKVSDVIKLWSSFFKDLCLGIFVIGVEAKSNNGSSKFSHNSYDSIDFSFILGVPSQELSPSWSVDDVFGNSDGLWNLDITINQVREVGEVKSDAELILFEPFVLVVVLNLLEVSFCVGEKVPEELSKSSDFPIPEGNLWHQDMFMNLLKRYVEFVSTDQEKL